MIERSDYEDYLVCIHFGNEPDHLVNCINAAYLDVSRTLHGIGDHPAGVKLRETATLELSQIFLALRDSANVANQDEFDDWHRAACGRLGSVYDQHGYNKLYVGQAQKWINMTFKYIFALGEKRIPEFRRFYEFCHAPLDRILVGQLGKHGFAFDGAWSRLDHYDKYLLHQKWIRERFEHPPLDVEFWLWMGKDIGKIIARKEEA